MRLFHVFALALAGPWIVACDDQEPLVFPETDTECAATFHEAMPEEPPWKSAPRFHAAVGEYENEQYGVLTVEPPYSATGHVSYQLDDDGAEGALDLDEGSFGFADGFQIDSAFGDGKDLKFASFSRWCADGTYMAMATGDAGSVTLFGSFRPVEGDERWYRAKPRGPDGVTDLQVMEIATYDCAYESGEDEAWHAERCNLLVSGTMNRRR